MLGLFVAVDAQNTNGTTLFQDKDFPSPSKVCNRIYAVEQRSPKKQTTLNLTFPEAEPCTLAVSGYDSNKLPSGAIGFVTVSGHDSNWICNHVWP